MAVRQCRVVSLASEQTVCCCVVAAMRSNALRKQRKGENSCLVPNAAIDLAVSVFLLCVCAPVVSRCALVPRSEKANRSFLWCLFGAVPIKK